MVENFQTKSADGISLWFLAVWFLGDVTNLIGALFAGLVPTVIALAAYFCVADTVLIIQCLYYRNFGASRRDIRKHSQSQADDVHEPLLGTGVSEVEPHGAGGNHSSEPYAQYNGNASPVSCAVGPKSQQGAPTWVKNTVACFAVCAIGTTGWVIAWKTGLWKPTVGRGDESDHVKNSIEAAILGYTSAVCYLG